MRAAIKHCTQQNNDTSNDCAWACFWMLKHYYTGSSPSIRELATRYGVVNKFTTVAQLVNGLNAEGVKVKNTREATFEWYLDKWAAGVPVIALLAMHVVSDNDGYPWAHFAIVTGVTDGRVTIYNPLKLTGPTSIPVAEFNRAITEPSRYVGGTNYPAQAVYPIVPDAAPIPLFATRIDAVAANLRQFAEAS
jgi:ABC-type bacteriocin/lantibiotic exporter with double-glycine peptidase domain